MFLSIPYFFWFPTFYQPIVQQFVGTCDAQLFPILSMAQDTMQLPGCSATDGRCSAACAGTWNAILAAVIPYFAWSLLPSLSPFPLQETLKASPTDIGSTTKRCATSGRF